MDYAKVVINIRNELKGYVQKNNIMSLVVGVSGGIDSALVCALAKPICNELDIPLIGRSIPIVGNKTNELARAELVGKAFCTQFSTKDLTSTFWGVRGVLFDSDESWEEFNGTGDQKHHLKIREGNIKARLRMVMLYDLAQKTGGMVLGTDNYTEFLLGFWTLMGDVGDYGMIQNLWKTEVYELSTWLVTNECIPQQQDALKLCIEAIPTDGLGITNSDYEQLGGVTDYREVDMILASHLDTKKRRESGEEAPYKGHPVILRHERTHFKRNWPISIPRLVLTND